MFSPPFRLPLGMAHTAMPYVLVTKFLKKFLLSQFRDPLSLFLNVSIFNFILTSECIAKYIHFTSLQKGIS